MKKTLIPALLVCLAAVIMTPRGNKAPTPRQKDTQHQTDWTTGVSIGAFGLRSDAAADEIVRKATESNVYGIEVDTDIPGRYESFLDPAPKLKAIKAVADASHKVG